MIKIEGQKITHMRGDSVVFAMNIMQGCKPYEWQDGDKAVLTIKKHIKDTSHVLQKNREGSCFVLTANDTKNLEPGNYVYDVQVTLADGQVSTIAGPAPYRLLRDVTTEVTTS